MSKSAFKFGVAVIAALSISGCTAIYRDHGYLPIESDLEQIVIGVDNRDTVQEVLGSPISSGILDDGAIFYTSTKVKHHSYREPKVVERTMLVVSFDADGQVANLETFGLEDGRVITLSRRVTTGPVKGPKILQQILGSIGNIDAASAIGG